MFPQITPSEVEQFVTNGEKCLVLDVREASEVATGKIPGATHIPLGQLLTRTAELNKDEEYIVVCHSGGRSSLACEWLTERGFKVRNMIGGMSSWSGRTE